MVNKYCTEKCTSGPFTPELTYVHLWIAVGKMLIPGLNRVIEVLYLIDSPAPVGRPVVKLPPGPSLSPTTSESERGDLSLHRLRTGTTLTHAAMISLL